MIYIFHLYLSFWIGNPGAAFMIHMLAGFCITAAIQTVRSERDSHLYHPRTYRDEHHARTEPEDTDGE